MPAAAENAAPTATTSVINGTVAGGSSAALANTSGTNSGAGAGMTVTVEGTGITATVNGAGQFVLSNVPAGAIVLRFSGGGANAQLSLGSIPAGTTITINVVVSGSTAALQQKTVNGDTEIEGRIESIAGSTLKVAGRTVVVTPSTIIRHGGTAMTLAQLAVGQRVHVKGSTTGTGSSTATTATTIIVQNDKANDDEFEAKGPVSSLTGACPAITFTLGGKTFRTNASTQFKGGSCSTIANGQTVEAEGTVQADGSVLAKKVEIDDDHNDRHEWEARGPISGLTGSCPAITFTLGGKTVRANSSTRFDGVTCASIANGTALKVKGALQADGSVVAKEIKRG